MDGEWTRLPEIIGAAATNVFGLLALVVILVSFLAYNFFREASIAVRISIFLLIFFGAATFVSVLIHEARMPVPPSTSGATHLDPTPRGNHVSNENDRHPAFRCQRALPAWLASVISFNFPVLTSYM